MTSISDDELFTEIQKLVKGKTILVTGGTGSIGGEIVKSILEFTPESIRILTNDETSLFLFNQEIEPSKRNRLRFFLGDVRDIRRMEKATKNVDIIFHAAALKHVEISEYNPFEAIQTNIIGTQNLIDVAIKEKVERFVLISTDKAASPLNVMGATKLLAEKIVTAAMYTKGSLGTKFVSVRFGNVFGSRGSIYPKLKQQILRRHPVTITNPDMTRFLMSIKEAVKLVFFALIEGRGGEVVVPVMKSISVENLIEGIVEYVTNKYDLNGNATEMETINVLPGEKMHEDLLSEDELRNTYLYEGYLIFKQPSKLGTSFDWGDIAERPNLNDYNSANSPKLSKKQLFSMIDEFETSHE